MAVVVVVLVVWVALSVPAALLISRWLGHLDGVHSRTGPNGELYRPLDERRSGGRT